MVMGTTVMMGIKITLREGHHRNTAEQYLNVGSDGTVRESVTGSVSSETAVATLGTRGAQV